MANRLYNEDSIRDIASAIREKNGTANTYSVAEMGQAIRGIQTESGGITPTGTIQIKTNGTHDVTQYASAYVSVPVGITPSGEIEITESGRFDVTNFASAFVNIATGGGSTESGLPSNVKTGVLNLESNSTTAVTITHGCGAIPKTVVVIPIDNIVGKGTVGGLSVEGVGAGISSADDGTKSFSVANATIQNATDTTFDFVPRSAAYPLLGGHSYLWVAIS